MPLYMKPPQRTWVGLTDEEMAEIIDAEIGFNSCWGPEEAFARAIEVAAQSSSETIALYASHDHALSALQTHCATGDDTALPRLHLDIRFCGSVDAIRALNEGRCSLAGFHVQPVCPAGGLSARTYKPLLKPGLHKIIGFARRAQGLMLAPGNPLGLRGLADVASSQARFVNAEKADTVPWHKAWAVVARTWGWVRKWRRPTWGWTLCHWPRNATRWCV